MKRTSARRSSRARVPRFVVYEFPSELQAHEFRREALSDGYQISGTSAREPWRVTAVDDGTTALDQIAHRHGADT